MAVDSGKQAAGYAAAELIPSDVLIGLGTGSTAAYFIERLGKRCQEGLKIAAVATSEKSLSLAKSLQIPITDIDQLTTLDIVVDGADEIDSTKRMIKGGGGALLREKIIASMCREMIVVVDSNKVVSQLGKFPLAIEIIPFAWKATVAKLKNLGYEGFLRKKAQDFYVTDGGHFIYDIHFSKLLESPEKIDQEIKNIPGVVETGFFFNLAKKVIIGYPDGKTKVW